MVPYSQILNQCLMGTWKGLNTRLLNTCFLAQVGGDGKKERAEGSLDQVSRQPKRKVTQIAEEAMIEGPQK